MSTEELAERRRNDRWAAHGRARVALPGRKAVVVPCASPFSAIQCAAELRGVPWQEVLRGARVLCPPQETEKDTACEDRQTRRR